MALRSSGDFAAAHMRTSKTSALSRLIVAAQRGDANSQFNLGVVYGNRFDDNRHLAGGDRAESVKWMLKAARQGLTRAQSRLAELYADGPDAPKRDVLACVWFTVAAKNSTGASRHSAEAGYARVASRMTEAQTSKAARLARDWVPKQDRQAATPAKSDNFPKKGER